jgi:hypothetical protein
MDAVSGGGMSTISAYLPPSHFGLRPPQRALSLCIGGCGYGGGCGCGAERTSARHFATR